MPLITTLDVINGMLATMGETPLNELDEDHPYVNAGLNVLKVTNLREQTKSWWFNKELASLKPQADTKHILVPDDTIRIDPTDQTLNYGQRGNRLYRMDAPASEDKFVFTGDVQVVLVRHIPFEELPATAAVYVEAAAILDFQSAYDGDRDKYVKLKAARDAALIALNAEHIRNVRTNLFQRPSTAAVLNAVQSGGRYVTR